jgi:hypothetical protein
MCDKKFQYKPPVLYFMKICAVVLMLLHAKSRTWQTCQQTKETGKYIQYMPLSLIMTEYKMFNTNVFLHIMQPICARIYKNELPVFLISTCTHTHTHTCMLLAPVLCQMNPVCANPFYFIIIFPATHSLSSGHYHLCFPTKILWTFLFSPICATCTAHPILLDLIT